MRRVKHCILCACVAVVFMMPIKTGARYNDERMKRNNSQFLVSIARPLEDECTYKKTVKVCGCTKKDDIRIRMFILRGDRYVPLRGTKGEVYWDIGESGVFTKEVLLPNKGHNKIFICSYEKEQEENLKAGENMQINGYNISFITSGVTIADILDKFF